MCSPEEGSRVTVKGKNMLPRGRKQDLKVYVNLSDLSLLPCQLHWSTVMVRGLDGVGMYPLTCLASISPFSYLFI